LSIEIEVVVKLQRGTENKLADKRCGHSVKNISFTYRLIQIPYQIDAFNTDDNTTDKQPALSSPVSIIAG
jgi:hypothetical protein